VQIRIVLFFCLLAIFITQSYAQVDCSPYLTCGDCTNTTTKSCGWCAATKSCVQGNAGGPANGFCDIGWIYYAKDCIDECKILADDCFDCNNIKHINCTWTKLNQCRSTKDIDPSYITSNCSCSMYHTCHECNAHKLGNCGYCPEKKACLDQGSAAGCTFRIDGTCPCNATYSCFDCLENDGCGWCTKRGICGMANSQDFMKLCNYAILPLTCSAICPQQKTCKDCMSIEGVSCGWCKNTTGAFCVDLVVTDVCFIEACEPAVYPPSGGFDGGSFVGGMFLALGLVGIAGAGYWYATRRQSYKPLN